jgi:hypothetical protein
MSTPIIDFNNPYKDCVYVGGMRQCGKTNLIAYLLAHKDPSINIWVFDTLGVIAKAFKGWKPANLTIFPVNFATKDAQFKTFCMNAWKRGNVICVIDEIHLFCAKKKTLPPHLSLLINQGGNHNVALWLTSQRTAQVHNDLLAACQHHFIFKLWLPQDVEWMSQVIDKAIVEKATTLEQYHFIYYHVGEKPQFCKPVSKMY